MSLLRSWIPKSSDIQLSWVPPRADSPNGQLSPADERTGSPASPSTASRRSPSATGNTTRRPESTSKRPADPLLPLQRYEADIQRHLQSLLDAQSEGLLAGIGGQDTDAKSTSETASSAGGERSTLMGKVVPVRQPTHKPTSLRGARRGIKSAMRELSIIKEKEDDIFQNELQSNEETVGRIKAWNERRHGLEREVRGIQTSQGSARAQELQREGDVLQEQITAMENQLMELKSQHNVIKLELARLENSVQSKLSSYAASLNMLDKEVREFLARPPQHPSRSAALDDTPYFALPPARRTLQMALEHMSDEKQAVEERQQSNREEREALEEGLVVWNDAVELVTKFEHQLRRSIQELGTQTPVDEVSASGTEPALGMSELIEQMELVVQDLESKFELADARGWKLLVCCIGAELEALKQGRSILDQAQAESKAGQDLVPSDEPTEALQEPVRSQSPEGSPVRRSIDSFRRRNDRPAPRVYRPEDDEPDPELLISRQDTDTE